MSPAAAAFCRLALLTVAVITTDREGCATATGTLTLSWAYVAGSTADVFTAWAVTVSVSGWFALTSAEAIGYVAPVHVVMAPTASVVAPHVTVPLCTPPPRVSVVIGRLPVLVTS